MFTVTIPYRTLPNRAGIWLIFQLAGDRDDDAPPVIERIDITSDAHGRRLICAGFDAARFPLSALSDISRRLVRHFALERRGTRSIA